MKITNYLLTLVLSAAVFAPAAAQSPQLFFREDWKEIEAALPVTQAHVANGNLVLSLYGEGRGGIKKSNHPHIPNDPYYIWSGECRATWAVGLRHRDHRVDLTGEGTVKVRCRQSGFRQLRITLKLQDGTWLVSDQSAASTEEWWEKEFVISDIRWRRLDIASITEGAWVENPDLRHVEEIGFTDLMKGGGTPASSRVDWIEVYGKPLKR